MLQQAVFRARRTVLKNCVPEFVWPDDCQIDSVRIKIRGAPYSFGVKRLLSNWPECYEGAERALCREAIRPGDQVLELGGSIGVVTAVLSRLVGSEGRVLSVEASPQLTEYSRGWLEDEGNVEIVTGCAFPVGESVPVSFRFDTSGGSMGGRLVFDESGPECQGYFIDDLMRTYDFAPTAMVLDIEGSEAILLRAEPKLPQTLSNIVMEMHPEIYGADAQLEIITVLQREGFELIAALDNVVWFRRR